MDDSNLSYYQYVIIKNQWSVKNAISILRGETEKDFHGQIETYSSVWYH